MILPAVTSSPSPTSVSNSDTQGCINSVATNSLVTSTSSSTSHEAVPSNEPISVEIQTCHHNQASAKPNSKETCCSDSCNGAQRVEASCMTDGSKVPNTESYKAENKAAEANDNGTKNGDIKNGEIKGREVKVEAMKSEGGVGGKSDKEEVIILDDSLDDDFKQSKKRFRTPVASTKDGPVSLRHMHMLQIENKHYSISIEFMSMHQAIVCVVLDH